MTDSSHTLIAFLSARIVELRERDGEHDVDKSMFMHNCLNRQR